ncbi:hypothetical protein KNU14_gp18 [Gordonia phage Buggaboo]|uniref:Uncharacterized protein n=3 Tax=Kablunavirus TaxID=2948776 RepID=A0A2D1GCV8_9CAUD|nr:hypothetical protein KNT75_gp19 [Gordonia phage Kabluna]YP_010098812.1 hypothetical protein KNU14_gp18 [Gordonia phage Buggaboo]YP_010101143.1 hypothetical protein KNU46_gp19 [Gordonia phage NosilaM]AVE00740.1 hypothetical protein SEA_SUPERSULLEY_18 [Gordonia phage SuperSulley]QXN73324.1 hypothetical protein SEA_BONUM_19 [Gordonia phage Bonum]ATN89540.1 hypothetical protein SEA_KABLUNA_19 [Gordonia phage Kabluna]AYD83210.1 hypothetical protein SEA_BUGGABOO_18 [Gordonia phage Buggaboo]QAU0
MKTAINAEVKERFGEDFYVKNSIVLALVERPRGDLERPDAPRISIFLKSLEPIDPSVAVKILEEAAAIYQRKRAEG